MDPVGKMIRWREDDGVEARKRERDHPGIRAAATQVLTFTHTVLPGHWGHRIKFDTLAMG